METETMNHLDASLARLRAREYWRTYGGRHCKPMLASDGDIAKLDERLTLVPRHRAEVAA